IAVGRPRPDFLDRCLGLYDNELAGTPLSQLADPINMLSNSTICTRTEHLKDGFKSFPSGHSSFSFGGLGYLSMYLAGKLHLFDERGHIYKSLVVLSPLIVAALIATSRVCDYRHHWHDVTIGSFIGTVFAIFSYRQYYPSLAATKSGRPFAPRVLEEILPTVLLPHIHHDDENHPDNAAHRESFLSNISNAGTYHRDGSREALTGNGTSMEDLGSNHGAKYSPGQTFEQSRQMQNGQRSNDGYLGPLS
ncbi:hypothetical protein BGZ51_006930, partial [Haplosporangium sp. Z 767]